MITRGEWLREQQIGKPGSAKRLYYDIKAALDDYGPFYEKLKCDQLLRKAFKYDDLEFFDKLAKGAHDYVSGEKTQSEGLIYFLPKAHEFLCTQKEIPLNRQTRRRLTSEMYLLNTNYRYEEANILLALAALKSSEPLRTMINAQVQKILKKHNWARYEKRAGVPELPRARSGRPSTRSRTGKAIG